MVIEKIVNDNKPLLVLIHGGNSSPSEWKEYKEALKDFKGGKSLHAPFGDLNLGSKNQTIKESQP